MVELLWYHASVSFDQRLLFVVISSECVYDQYVLHLAH